MMPFANGIGLWLCLVFPALLILAAVGRWKLGRQASLWGGYENVRALAHPPARESDTFRSAALWLALALTFMAFARPQWGEVAESVQKVGLDVVVLLDTSRSMTVSDVQPDRLERARMEIRSFLSSDEGDRVGLVAFAGVPLTLSPLTEDTPAISMLLDIADEHLIPVQGTDIGKAVKDALGLMPRSHDRDRVILLFSDGEDMASGAPAAARAAARRGVKIFCVGVGTPAGGPVPGPEDKPMKDPDTGAVAISHLDEAGMRQLAGLSDGRYWTLSGQGSVVPQILSEFSRLKRKEYASRSRSMRQDQFAWFLAPAVFLLFLALFIPGRRKPGGGPPPDRERKAGKSRTAGPGALLFAALLLGAMAPAASPRAESSARLAQRAQQAFHAGQTESALALYRQAIEETDSPALKALLHFNAGTCLLALHKPGDAQDELTLALASPNTQVKLRALYNLAHALYASGDRQRALASLRTILISDPADRRAQLFYEWLLRNKPPEQKPPPEKQPPKPPPKVKPPDVLEQLPMPPPKELQDQMRKPAKIPPGMKPW